MAYGQPWKYIINLEESNKIFISTEYIMKEGIRLDYLPFSSNRLWLPYSDSKTW